MPNQNTENKIFWIDNLRAFATLSVIVLHVSFNIVDLYGKVPDGHWWIGNIIDGAARFCVPIFLMITGALLIPKTDDFPTFLRRRFTRILYPFLFWSFVYIAFNLLGKFLHGEQLVNLHTTYFIFDQLKNGASYQFWYVYMIIGLYLFLPIIGRWTRSAPTNEIAYFLLIWAFTFFLNFVFISKYFPMFDLINFSGYAGYIVLGYLLTRINIYTEPNLKYKILFIIISGIIITVVGTYIFSKLDQKFNGLFYSYLTPNVLAASFGFYIYFKSYFNRKGAISTIVSLVSRYSFGNYLVHVLVLAQLFRFGIESNFINPL